MATPTTPTRAIGTSAIPPFSTRAESRHGILPSRMRFIWPLIFILSLITTSDPVSAQPAPAPSPTLISPSPTAPTTPTPAAASAAATAPSTPTATATTTPTASTATAPPADTSERFFGAVQAIYNPDRAAQAGVQWERLIFPWSLIQKTGPNTWNDGYFTDQQIKQEAARGIQIVGLATYTPQWASSTPRTPRTTNVPANLYLPFDDPQNYWGQFMFKLAQRYAGKIDTWVVWNEPDMYTDQILYTWDG